LFSSLRLSPPPAAKAPRSPFYSTRHQYNYIGGLILVKNNKAVNCLSTLPGIFAVLPSLFELQISLWQNFRTLGINKTVLRLAA